MTTATTTPDTAHVFQFRAEAFDRFVAADEDRDFPSVAYLPGKNEGFSATHWLRWILLNSDAVTAQDPRMSLTLNIAEGQYRVRIADHRDGGVLFKSDWQEFEHPWEDAESQEAFSITPESVARQHLIAICELANKTYQAGQVDIMRETISEAAALVRAALTQAEAHQHQVGPLGRIEAPQLTKILADVNSGLASVHDYLTQANDVAAGETNR